MPAYRLRQWHALRNGKAHRWGDDEKPYGAFAAIGAAIASKRNPVTPGEMKALFAFAERLLQQGSGEVANMVATSFLEELWHATRDRNFDFSLVNGLLGIESRAYLVAWDQFNKTKTPGLNVR